MGILEKIKEIEEEMAKTQKNKVGSRGWGGGGIMITALTHSGHRISFGWVQVSCIVFHRAADIVRSQERSRPSSPNYVENSSTPQAQVVLRSPVTDSMSDNLVTLEWS